MGTITLPNNPGTIQNTQVTDATKVMENFTAIVNECNGSLDAANLAALAVETAKIAALAVTAAKLAADAVETLKIKDLNVTTGKLAVDAVDGTKIGDDVIDSEHYAAGSIDAEHLAVDSVETAKIKNLNVTVGKLAADAVETAKIKDANVTAAKLAADAVETLKIKDANVTFPKLGLNAFITTLLDDEDAETVLTTLGIVDSFTPEGSIIAWIPGYFTDGVNGGYTPVAITLNDSWKKCDGAALNDASSTIFNGAGRYLPKLTDDRFLMGDTFGAVGGIGGDNNAMAHTHTYPNHKHQTGKLTLEGAWHKLWMHNSAGGDVPICNRIGLEAGAEHGLGAFQNSVMNLYTKTDGGGNCSSVVESRTNKNMPKYLSCQYIMKVRA